MRATHLQDIDKSYFSWHWRKCQLWKKINEKQIVLMIRREDERKQALDDAASGRRHFSQKLHISQVDFPLTLTSMRGLWHPQQSQNLLIQHLHISLQVFLAVFSMDEIFHGVLWPRNLGNIAQSRKWRVMACNPLEDLYFWPYWYIELLGMSEVFNSI